MKKKLIILLSISFCVFLVGFGMRFSTDQLVSDIGLWISFLGAFLQAVFSIYGCIDSQIKKKHRKGLGKKVEMKESDCKDKK